MSSHPLVIDLDGTLIYTDMLHESVLGILHNNPLNSFSMLYWLSQGKAALKHHVADRMRFDLTTLPYNHDLLDWLKQERANGRKLILCTGTNLSIATAISDHLNVFDEVMASDGTTNLTGKNKADLLEQRFGHGGFDYAGNSHADLAVWARARNAIVVNASAKLAKKVAMHCPVERHIPRSTLNFTVWSKVLRLHQWLKNLLLFVPLFAAHQLMNVAAWSNLVFAFFSFSLCASSTYIINDLLDLQSDRQHHRKRNRPFASGQIEVWKGVLLIPLLLLASLILASQVNNIFLLCLLMYFLLTCTYSFLLKRLILIDCLTLAVLYTLRIISGNAAIDIPLSFWLLAFSVFLFSSLAFVKRYAELQLQVLSGKQKIHGRSYYTSDAPMIQMFGVATGYVAVLILALYINSDAVMKLYQAPKIVWGAVPIMLFWVSWMWMQAHRGKMHDDPFIFAIQDKASLIAGVIFAITLVMGAVGLSW